MSLLENLKILCVEDDDFALQEMALFLKKRAGKVFTASDGMEGIRQYEIHKPDIIIVDILMPHMDGMEMIRRIRKKNRDVHVLIVSSVSVLDTVLESINLGIDNYIVKPLEFSELEEKLNQIGAAISVEGNSSRGIFDTMEQRRSIEDAIKKEFIRVLKSYMGKGPKEISVQLAGREIRITVFASLTVMEKNLISKVKNHGLVKQVRHTAYEDISADFCRFLSETLGREVVCDKISIDLKKEMELLRFMASS